MIIKKSIVQIYAWFIQMDSFWSIVECGAHPNHIMLPLATRQLLSKQNVHTVNLETRNHKIKDKKTNINVTSKNKSILC